MNWFTGIDLRVFFRDLGIIALIYLFWWFPLLYPLQLLSTFFHELGHAMGAILTGGSVLHIEIHPDGSGKCRAVNGSLFIVASSGYLGSVAWGGLLMVLTRKSNWAPRLAIFVGLLMIGVALLWIRPLGSFGFIYALVFGMFWILIAILFRQHRWLHIALHFVALVICFDAVLSTMNTLSHMQTDAAILAARTNTPSQVWAILWVASSFVMGILFLLLSSSDSFERKRSPE